MSETALMSTPTYVVCERIFSPRELDSVQYYADSLDQQTATLIGEGWARDSNAAARIRISRTAALTFMPETKWLYDRMQLVIWEVNQKFYQFDLQGFAEPFQYATYHGTESGHYTWHLDWGSNRLHRKLSASIQLTDPSQYEGCDLQFHGLREIETAPRARGTVIVFPSFIQHRVTPCTYGTRKAIVVWASGPQFR